MKSTPTNIKKQKKRLLRISKIKKLKEEKNLAKNIFRHFHVKLGKQKK